ncbi:MAG: D-glycerate dehydrogenase [Firmicutes bacterium]|nr:D-glycerate dehydrogenase [Bacillota bacterium]
MSNKVYVTREIPKIGLDILSKYFEVEVNKKDRPLTKDELISKIKGKDAVLTQLTDQIDKEVIEKANTVKIFANYAVGYNNIDIEFAKKRDIIVTNTPEVLSDTTAELAWALLFAVSRRVVEGDNYVRKGKWKQFSPKLLLGQDINNKTLGIIGAGRIGKAFAKKSIGYDMEILYHNRSRDMEFEKVYNAKWVDMDTLLNRSDFISLHVPLTDATYHLIGKKELNNMKDTAILINTSRGAVIDEEALVKALENEVIWGAGLDVFENEPVVHNKLLDMDNVVLLPHIGSASTETRDKMAKIAAKNIVQVLKGKDPISQVK